MNKIQLTTEQELSFQKSLKQEKKHSARIISILGAVLFLCLTIINYFALPANEFSNVLPTTLATLLVLGIFYTLTYRSYFLKHYSLIGMATFLTVGLAICMMIALSTPGRYSHNVYYLALILLIVTIFSWSYMPLRLSVLVTTVLIAIFSAIKIGLHNALSEELLVLVVSLFFLIASASIVAMAQVLRDKYILKSFLLQEQLKINFEEKAKEAKHQKELANKDALTGLPNRRYITKTLDKAIQQAQDKNLDLVIMFLDLNGFKAVNDTYGHDAGDEILTVISDRLKSCIRDEDHLARIGGDEFLIGLLVKKSEADIPEKIRTKIRTNVIEPVTFNEHFLKVGTSIGTACYPTDGNDIEALIKLADDNMYADKIRIKSIQKSTEVELAEST